MESAPHNNIVIIGDIQLISPHVSMKQLISLMLGLIADKSVRDYLGEFERRRKLNQATYAG
jgi:hypothetical protein